MGLSGLILRKANKMNLEEIKNCMVDITTKLEYHILVDLEKHDSGNSYFFSVNKELTMECRECFVMYLYGKKDIGEETYFNWIDNDLGRTVIIESISGCENMILEILHEYFKIYPKDYFYDELKWFYTKEDIDRIYDSGDWKDWCFKNPKE